MRPFLGLVVGREFKRSAVLDMGWLGGWTHPAPDTDRPSKNRHPSGQVKGSSELAETRHLCMASPVGVLRCR